MAEAQDSVIELSDAEDTAHDIKTKIEGAMRTRAHYFKQVADSMTVKQVRRLLEKDLELQINALDVHTRFIKDCLLEFLDPAADDKACNYFGEAVKNDGSPVMVESKMLEKRSTKKGFKEPKSEDADEKKDSPVLGLMTVPKKTGGKVIKENLNISMLSMIQNAIRKRESCIKDNSVRLSPMGVRRLLEEDLNLDKYTLDVHKKVISKELGKVMQTKSSVEVEVNLKKLFASKGKSKNSKGLKKRKMNKNEANTPIKKQTKHPNDATEGSSDGNGNVFKDSQSSTEKTIKKGAVQPLYVKYVEHLRSVIKFYGMSVPLSIYKKLKQVPENKSEAWLIRELENILSREGLSPNLSEKEIKKVKNKKDRAEELKGIDMSNILPCSRKRSTVSFVPSPKLQEPYETDDVHSEHNDDDEDSEGDDGSQSDEVDEENDEVSESF